jgi:hypothetical protein
MFKSLSLLILFFGFSSFGQVDPCFNRKFEAFNPRKGMIPLAFGVRPAADLICNLDDCQNGVKRGELLSPKQAVDLYEYQSDLTRCNWDLSLVDPAQVPGVWENKVNTEGDDLGINTSDNVEFVSKGWTKVGSFRVTVNKTNSHGTPIQYSLFLNKSIHNYLLRKALLRKLGYSVSAVKYLKTITINFDTKDQKKSFMNQLKDSGAGSLNRWVQSEKAKRVVLQDLVAMEDQEFKLNLAKGYISPDIFEGKRIYRSLLIPYALTNTPESINMFKWTVGRIISENVRLDYPYADEFRTSRDDARWMVKRILDLTEQDWKDIVKAAHLPASVEVLLLEKLKSRRNHLGALFSIDNVNLSTNTIISNGDDLKDGKLTKYFYAGYGRQFRIEEPDSPLSFSEMTSFLRAKGRSLGIEMLLKAFNSSKFMGTDISGKVEEFNEKVLADAVAQNLTTNATTRTPIKTFAFPTFKGNLILNRQIVAGSYLGTDNTIQLVDTLGASISAGAFSGVTGVYSQTGKVVQSADGPVRQYAPVDLKGNANVFYNRTYAHIRPITSIQKALKYPFKNLAVPYLKRKYGHLLDEIISEPYENLTAAQKRQQNELFVNGLKELLNNLKTSRSKIAQKYQSEDVNIALDDLEKLVNENEKDILESITQTQVISRLVDSITNLDSTMLAAYESSSTCRKEQTDKICPYKSKKRYVRHFKNYKKNIVAIIKKVKRQQIKVNNQEKETQLTEVTSLISENLEINESMVVTDSVGASLGVSAGMTFFNVIKTKLNIGGRKVITGRLHFFRASENEIHVYKDLGNLNGFEMSLGVKAFVPLVKINFTANKGRGKVKFYKVNIGELEDAYYQTKNENRVEKLKALRSVLLTGSIKKLDNVQKPVVLKHKFSEDDAKAAALVLRASRLKQADKVEVVLPSGHSKLLYRNMIGKTQGRDFESYFDDLVGTLAGKILKSEFFPTNFSATNPGFTYYGKATNKIVSYEGELDDKNEVKKPYMKLSRIINGWKLPKEKALKKLRQIRDKYRYKFFEDGTLAQTKELFLYNINVNFFIYDTAVKHMLSLPEKEIKRIWKNFQSRDMTNFAGDDALILSGIKRFLKQKKKYLKFKKRGNLKKLSTALMKMISIADDKLTLKGLTQLYGGAKNFSALAKIDGFRVGDENGDQAIFSNSYGRFGKESLDGPFRKMKKLLGITTGEFMMSWLLGRVI